ncbi:PREDICTED: ubiquinol-cytochrome c reductase complex 6.7 kDa protein-like [Camelina sativa]|uniref:Ubiquinol-cytochrome c reductase complex 6.7 kDa protein-like n=1 Tax=Camelina sativa TaxID=90675 RepID=A0ABM1RNG4_CAMSA|nr:PREDICTED: ubiquinol-cytochrome c reductase complex 6.7 kDa protein-like [Camelina sativa]XP_019102569.1 PREDICTED: ubiquinol-cytochrome c reductase complex 6.7 kDa protein-like [Camelina sativa]
MAGTAGLLKVVKPKIQPVDIQAAAGWGIAAAAGAIWVVQPFDWIKKTFIDPPPVEEK